MKHHTHTYQLFFLAGACSLALLGSCCVHEFPEQETLSQAHHVRLHLDFQADLPQYQVVKYARTRATDSYDTRYQLRIYRTDETGTYATDEFSTVLDTKDETDNPNHHLDLQLEEGNYYLYAWADYVDENSQDDKFYDTGDFEEIVLQGDRHTGNTDFRDAFRGIDYLTVTAEGAQEHTMTMERPMARYNFITTDVDLFLTRMLQQLEANAEKAGNNGDAATKAPNLNDYRILFRYTAFMPSTFNILADKPIDSRTGVAFEGQIRRLSDTEAELGFDYVFVNGTEATVQVAVEIRNTDGQTVPSAGPIDVPLMRSHLTTVRGPFLTSEATGGVGIDPDFDGEWNYEIR